MTVPPQKGLVLGLQRAGWGCLPRGASLFWKGQGSLLCGKRS